MPVRTEVRGLTIILADADPERFRTALTLAAANAALGGRARVFAQGRAVTLLRPAITAPDDEAHAAAGLPLVCALFDEALGLGVEVIACQSGLALSGLTAAALDARATFAGPVSILQDLDGDRLITV